MERALTNLIASLNQDCWDVAYALLIIWLSLGKPTNTFILGPLGFTLVNQRARFSRVTLSSMKVSHKLRRHAPPCRVSKPRDVSPHAQYSRSIVLRKRMLMSGRCRKLLAAFSRVCTRRLCGSYRNSNTASCHLQVPVQVRSFSLQVVGKNVYLPSRVLYVYR